MKKYFCDVCGVELPEWNEISVIGFSPAADVCDLTELCPRCETLTFKLNISAVVLAELKRLAAADEGVEPAPPSAPVTAPGPKGKAAREKRAILAAIETFRKERGSGSIPALAELAKVKESVLRDMIQCLSVPILEWRKVGKVLGVGKAMEEGSAAL